MSSESKNQNLSSAITSTARRIVDKNIGGYETQYGADGAIYTRRRGSTDRWKTQWGDEVDLSNPMHPKTVKYSGRYKANGTYYIPAQVWEASGFKYTGDVGQYKGYAGKSGIWGRTDANGNIIELFPVGTQRTESDRNIYQYNTDGSRTMVYDRRHNKLNAAANANTRLQAKNASTSYGKINWEQNFDSFKNNNYQALSNALYNSPEGANYLQHWRDQGIDPMSSRYKDQILEAWFADVYNTKAKAAGQKVPIVKQNIYTDKATFETAARNQDLRNSDEQKAQALHRLHNGILDTGKPAENKDYSSYSNEELADIRRTWDSSIDEIHDQLEMAPMEIASTILVPGGASEAIRAGLHKKVGNWFVKQAMNVVKHPFQAVIAPTALSNGTSAALNYFGVDKNVSDGISSAVGSLGGGAFGKWGRNFITGKWGDQLAKNWTGKAFNFFLDKGVDKTTKELAQEAVKGFVGTMSTHWAERNLLGNNTLSEFLANQGIGGIPTNIAVAQGEKGITSGVQAAGRWGYNKGSDLFQKFVLDRIKNLHL